MIDQLKDFISDLSVKMGKDITFEYTIHSDSPMSSWPNFREQFRICANNHKSVYRATLKQVLAITKEDFISE